MLTPESDTSAYLHNNNLNIKALCLNFQGRIFEYLYYCIYSILIIYNPFLVFTSKFESVFFASGTVAYFHNIKNISLQVHIVHVSVILNFILFRAHAAVLLLACCSASGIPC
jgi:hypothetical protein